MTREQIEAAAEKWVAERLCSRPPHDVLFTKDVIDFALSQVEALREEFLQHEGV